MVNISDTFFKKNNILINVNREGRISAAFITHSEYGGYIWLADVDTAELQLDKFPCILGFLQHTTSGLELSFINNMLDAAEIVAIQREGGYKEPFHRVVQYSSQGYNCLNNLESTLSTQLQSENQKMRSLKKNY